MAYDTDQLSDEDVRCLEQLVTEIAWRIDHKKVDTVYELFAKDGVYIFSPGSMVDPPERRGQDEIMEWGRWRATQNPQGLHICSNMRFSATGPDRAEGSTYLIAYAEDPGEGVHPSMVGEYQDEFVRIDGKWLFSRRTTLRISERPS